MENCLGCITICAQELDLFFTLLDVLASVILNVDRKEQQKKVNKYCTCVRCNN